MTSTDAATASAAFEVAAGDDAVTVVENADERLSAAERHEVATAQPVQQFQAMGQQPLTAGLVAGEVGLVDDSDADAASGQSQGDRGAAEASAHHNHISVR